MEISVEAHAELGKLFRKNGLAHVEKYVIPENEFSHLLHECERQHPEESYEQHFLRVCYRYACHKCRKPIPSQPAPISAREFRWWAVVMVLLLIFSLAKRAHGQIDVIKVQDNTGSTIKTFAAPFTFKAGANCTPAVSGSTLTFNCAGGAAAAGGLNTQVQVNSAGSLGGITNVTSDGTNLTKLTSTGTIDFSGSTIFKNRFGAGLTTSTNGDCGYDTTNNRWHCWQGGADRLMIASTNIGVSGQAFLSNADGSGVFADPIVSGPDAVAAAPTKNPVQIGGLFLTTPATLTNNQVGALQLDNLQNALVKVNVALPAGANVIGHIIADSGSTTAVSGNVATTVADGANVVLGAKGDAKSTATDTTAISIMSVLKEISDKEQNPATQAVTGTFWQATQPVSGTFWQATQPVSGTFFQATQPVSIADGSDVTLGAKADAKSTATDTTVVSVMAVLKEISAMEQAPASRAVTNAGTFAVQEATLDGAISGGVVQDNLKQVNGVALGSPSNYGTSPGAVVVPGVNAFITNSPTDTQGSAGSNAQAWWTQIGDTTRGPAAVKAVNPDGSEYGVVVRDPALVALLNLVSIQGNLSKPITARLTGTFGRPLSSTGDAADVYQKYPPASFDPCAGPNKTPLAISVTANTKLISALSTPIRICSIFLMSTSAETFSLVEGTGSTCGTGTLAVIGAATAASGPAPAANGGFTLGNGAAWVASTKTPDTDLCIFISGSTLIAGNLTYAF